MPCSCDPQSVPCATLVRDALAGQRQAFADLIGKFTPLIIHISRRYSGGHVGLDGEDAVQDLTLHLLERRGAEQVTRLSLWGHEGKFCAWLSSVVTRLCLSRRRGLKPVRNVIDDDEARIVAVSKADGPDIALEHQDQLAAVERKVATFPLDHQIVFWNHFIHGLTYAELGRILDKNERVLRRWMDEIKAVLDE